MSVTAMPHVAQSATSLQTQSLLSLKNQCNHMACRPSPQLKTDRYILGFSVTSCLRKKRVQLSPNHVPTLLPTAQETQKSTVSASPPLQRKAIHAEALSFLSVVFKATAVCSVLSQLAGILRNAVILLSGASPGPVTPDSCKHHACGSAACSAT